MAPTPRRAIGYRLQRCALASACTRVGATWHARAASQQQPATCCRCCSVAELVRARGAQCTWVVPWLTGVVCVLHRIAGARAGYVSAMEIHRPHTSTVHLQPVHTSRTARVRAHKDAGAVVAEAPGPPGGARGQAARCQRLRAPAFARLSWPHKVWTALGAVPAQAHHRNHQQMCRAAVTPMVARTSAASLAGRVTRLADGLAQESRHGRARNTRVRRPPTTSACSSMPAPLCP